VISLCQDREGDLWSGTGSGLVMMRPNNIRTLSPPDQWKGRAALSVCAGGDGALWVGTEGAGLYRFQNGVWTNFNTAQGILNPYIWSLAEDASGRLWAGTWGGGLFVQNDGSFHFAPGMEKITQPMPSLLPTPEALWIGTTAGLLRYQNGDTARFNSKAGQTLDDVRAISRDRQGAIWFGTAGDGLACLQGQTIRQFKKSEGLSSDFIECLHFDAEGTLWIGTFGGGLNRFKDGHFAIINRNQGLPNNVIGDIEDDDHGFFWMSSFGGIMRVSEADLNECADGKIQKVHCLTYGINDGLPTLECTEGLQPAGCKTPDGHLWFTTGKGVASVDPANMTTNFLPPPVIIEEMRVDDKPFASGTFAAALLKIPPGRHRLEFQYTGLSLVAPEKVRFKYRLKGFDDDWVDAGTKRLASYNYIPPGNYFFQVIACNNDYVWNETGANLVFIVLPFFWQTSWFRFSAMALVIAASGGLVWFDTRRRMRRKLALAERQRDIERERARIARDIHDDLGVHLTRITMISESARGGSLNAERAAKGLGKIYDMACELTRSMDEIVWAVNPRHDTLESLATYLEKFAQDWLAVVGIRFRLDFPVQFPEWRLTSEVRHNLFLACKEALHNVVKHSAATEVSIRLVLNKLAFELSVEDNGRGFLSDTSGRMLSGNGLENMRRRLSEIGGICEIQSEPGKGTRVIFSIWLKPEAL
jgi:signal transduction histidine kinase/streptogramin lyase